MKKITTAIVTIFCLLNINVSGQTIVKRNCGTMSHLSDQISRDPSIVNRMNQIEQQTNSFISSRTASSSFAAATTVVIPVVFHVLYNTTAQNISDAQCIAQLNQLNLDYAKLNSDTTKIPSVFKGLAANTNIQFCLAQRDANGVATNGIIHKSTTTTSFGSDDKVKSSSTGGDNAWPSSSYLNIWSCNLGSGLLGYAQFPGGTASTDGVVLLYSTIGSISSPGTTTSYNLGRTATHEVGHWLNLRHIWGDANCGSDLVGDTPTQQTSNYGCPTFPHKTCSNTTNGDMFMNYMDYTDDACMFMFSAGQSTRMNALFASGGSRASLLTSTGCQPVSNTCAIPTGLAASSIAATTATLGWTAVSGAASYNVKYKRTVDSLWTSTTSTTNLKSITGLIASTSYQFQVQTVCTSTGTSSWTTAATFTTIAAATCAIPTGLTASSITATTATLGWSAVSGVASYNVKYKKTVDSLWISTTSTTNSKAITGLVASTSYQFQVQTACTSTGTSSWTTSATFTTIATVCQSTYDNTTNGAITGAAVIPFNTNTTGLINIAGDVDFYKFSITKAGTITLTLTTLPADFDLYLVNSSGTTLSSSLITGTTSETINYTAAKGTYYAKVVGYSNAFNASSCYTLKVQLGTATKQIGNTSLNEFVKVYPNPANDKIQLSIKNSISDNSSFMIFDSKGRVVMQHQLQENLQAIDISMLARGFYLIKINNGGVINTEKFIKL